MYQPMNEQLFVTSLADADRCLMSTLAASDGLEFALYFRIEYADEIARALWESAKYRIYHSTSDAHCSHVMH